MTTIAEYDNLKVPTWALSYLVNGDDSGISDEDKAQADEWYKWYEDKAQEVNGHVILASMEPDSEPYFTRYPEFGLACDVEDYTILIVK